MQYCPFCGAVLVENATFCHRCGRSVNGVPRQPKSRQWELLETLSARYRINGIIWIVIAALQLLLGLIYLMEWSLSGLWISGVGVLNLLSAVRDLQNSRRIMIDPTGIVASCQPLTSTIIAMVYNTVVGGFIGVAGNIYYLIFIRGFVLRNKEAFLAMEGKTVPGNTVEIEVYLTPQEACSGVSKVVHIVQLNTSVRVNFPANIHHGQTVRLHNIAGTDPLGRKLNKDVYIKVNTQGYN